MKKTETHWQAVFLTGMIFLFGIATAQARSLEAIKASKEIRICISPDISVATAAPDDCIENCTFSGPVYEETLAFAEYLGSDIIPRFTKIEWHEQFFNKDGKIIYDADYTPEPFASGKCDIYPSNLTKTKWRSKKMDFVILFPSRMMVIVHKSQKANFKTTSDLAGKRVSLVRNTTYYNWIQGQNQNVCLDNPIKVEFVLSDEEATERVMAGKSDFTLIDADKAVWIIRHKFKNTVVAFPVGPTDEIGWTFCKQDKDLRAIAQKFFDEQRSETSIFNQIWMKYFGVTLNKFISIIRATK